MKAPKTEKLLWDNATFSKRASVAERLTSVYAEKLVQYVGVPDYPQKSPLVVLDNACGTGVVTQALQDALQDRPEDSFEVTCGDFADAMIKSASERVQSGGWKNTKVLEVDAQDTNLPSGHFTHVFTNFGPMIFPNASAMLSECHRILRPQGTCAFTTWKKIGWMNDFKEVFNSMSDLPPLRPEKFGAAYSKGQWWDADWIKRELSQHGFENIQIQEVPNTSVAEDIEEMRELLRPIVGIIYTFWTEDERQTHKNAETEKRIEEWFVQRYGGGPVRWDWIALVTTSTRPA